MGYDAEREKADNRANFEALKPGAYVCNVMQVKETKSKSGKDMLVVALDIAEGEEAGRFQLLFNGDNREDKKWPCLSYILTEDKDGNCSRSLADFLKFVEDSNKNFTVEWGDNFCKNLTGKTVGVVFRREEYLNQQGEKKWSTKPIWYADAEKVREGKVKTPEDKPLNETASTPFSNKPPVNFEEVEGDLPF